MIPGYVLSSFMRVSPVLITLWGYGVFTFDGLCAWVVCHKWLVLLLVLFFLFVFWWVAFET